MALRHRGHQADPEEHPGCGRRPARGRHGRGCADRVEPRRAAARWRLVVGGSPPGHRRRGGVAHRGLAGRKDPFRPRRAEGRRARCQGHDARPRLHLQPWRDGQGRALQVIDSELEPRWEYNHLQHYKVIQQLNLLEPYNYQYPDGNPLTSDFYMSSVEHRPPQ